LIRLTADYDVSSFDCGDADLCEFLRDDALRYQTKLLASTTLLFAADEVVAYFSLATDALGLAEPQRLRRRIKTSFSQMPALKIARLATDKRHQGNGYGTHALQFCVGLARHLNDVDRHDGVGCRFLTVDAYPGAVDWYAGFGFARPDKIDKSRHTVNMWLDLMPNED
jgi:GNAT superfamily N-acetyltransferase